MSPKKGKPFFTDVFGRSYDSMAEVERDLRQRQGALVDPVPAKLTKELTKAGADGSQVPCRVRVAGGAISIEDVGGSIITMTRWPELQPSRDGLTFETPGLTSEGFVGLRVEPAPNQLDDWLSLVRSQGRLEGASE